MADAVSIEVWVERGFYRGNDSQQLNWGWDSFKDFTKNQTRYFFLHRDEDGDDDGDLTPAELLAAFANVLKSQLTELIKVVTPATDLVRVRIGGEPHTSARAIGAPEREFATQSNRMSPAGIPMFYGAFDFETAYAETYDANLHAGGVISTGSFRAVRDLNVLDLAELPYIPSVFDNERREVIHFLRFLHSFANDISMPIARDGREHIEYVPTQIVTEYFRRVFRTGNGSALDGIVYRSSRNPDGRAFVLFCENRECIDPDDEASHDALLRLVNVTHRAC